MILLGQTSTQRPQLIHADGSILATSSLVNPRIDEEVFVTGYECNVSSLSGYLTEYTNLNELNYLAEKIDKIEDGI